VRAAEDGSVLLTAAQREWTDVMERMIALRPKQYVPCPTEPGRAWCFRLSKDKRFDHTIFGAIVFNTLLMAVDGYGISPREAALLSSLNDLCTCVFILEAIVKIMGYSLNGYLSEPWHVFDLSIICVAVLDWSASLLLGSTAEGQPTLVRVLRLTRVLRTLRVVRSARGLSMLFSMLLVAIAGLMNILCLYLILLTIYALLAMQLYGDVAYGEMLGAHANFCTFPTALLTLFRCATGEEWNGLMADLMVNEGSGRCSDAAGNCGSWTAVPFFVSYMILAAWIELKMVIALINENYSMALHREQNSLKAEHADEYVQAWAQYDTDATGCLHIRHLTPLLRGLPPPLGLDPEVHGVLGVVRASDVSRYIYQMHDLRSYHNAPGQKPEVRCDMRCEGVEAAAEGVEAAAEGVEAAAEGVEAAAEGVEAAAEGVEAAAEAVEAAAEGVEAAAEGVEAAAEAASMRATRTRAAHPPRNLS
jgi:hypothetical protein